MEFNFGRNKNLENEGQKFTEKISCCVMKLFLKSRLLSE